jgi:hypothetical protein
VLELGVPAIFAYLTLCLDRLEAVLLERGFRSFRTAHVSGRSGILSVLPPAPLKVLDVHRGLAQRGIVCGVPDGVLRFSPHWPNALLEVDVVAEAIDDVIAASRT